MRVQFGQQVNLKMMQILTLLILLGRSGVVAKIWGCSNEPSVLLPSSLDLMDLRRPLVYDCPTQVEVTGNVVTRMSETIVEILPTVDYECLIMFDEDIYRLRSIIIDTTPTHLPATIAETLSSKKKFEAAEVSFNFFQISTTARHQRVVLGALVFLSAYVRVKVRPSELTLYPSPLFIVPRVIGASVAQSISLTSSFPLDAFVSQPDFPAEMENVAPVVIFTDHCISPGGNELRIFARQPLQATTAFELSLRQMFLPSVSVGHFKKGVKGFISVTNVLLDLEELDIRAFSTSPRPITQGATFVTSTLDPQDPESDYIEYELAETPNGFRVDMVRSPFSPIATGTLTLNITTTTTTTTTSTTLTTLPRVSSSCPYATATTSTTTTLATLTRVSSSCPYATTTTPYSILPVEPVIVPIPRVTPVPVPVESVIMVFPNGRSRQVPISRLVCFNETTGDLCSTQDLSSRTYYYPLTSSNERPVLIPVSLTESSTGSAEFIFTREAQNQRYQDFGELNRDRDDGAETNEEHTFQFHTLRPRQASNTVPVGGSSTPVSLAVTMIFPNGRSRRVPITRLVCFNETTGDLCSTQDPFGRTYYYPLPSTNDRPVLIPVSLTEPSFNSAESSSYGHGQKFRNDRSENYFSVDNPNELFVPEYESTSQFQSFSFPPANDVVRFQSSVPFAPPVSLRSSFVPALRRPKYFVPPPTGIANKAVVPSPQSIKQNADDSNAIATSNVDELDTDVIADKINDAPAVEEEAQLTNYDLRSNTTEYLTTEEEFHHG
eukprot:Gregarina_sp_Poly_1__10858@NODE_842_length_6017_cov_94_978151_g609_i0_p1_GENE_NODE_842_length_6017_cov_94_978151_g609_i0NODE_842_length_6017_cov_94_978151_g609_i0_p1_ORF_typecomplete_len778_score84_40RseA_C/PF03873_13/1_9e02RseA_C/PF03873_13/2_1RseA_C/PF03873_13/7_2e02_NODE_842_length_6017_cov_94_978151_g609_i07973130